MEKSNYKFLSFKKLNLNLFQIILLKEKIKKFYKIYYDLENRTKFKTIQKKWNTIIMKMNMQLLVLQMNQ